MREVGFYMRGDVDHLVERSKVMKRDIAVRSKPEICDGCDRPMGGNLVPIFPHSPHMKEAIWLCASCLCYDDIVIPIGRWH